MMSLSCFGGRSDSVSAVRGHREVRMMVAVLMRGWMLDGDVYP